MSEQNRISDESDDRKYYVLIPQLVWARCRDPYELTLWCVIKKIAGEEGACFLSTEDLATAAMMSVGKASQCRQRLIAAGLLKGEIERDPGYPQPVWHLSIPNLWPENLTWAEANPSLKDQIAAKAEQRAGLQETRRKKREKRLHQVKPSPGEEGTSPGEANKIQKEEPERSASAFTEEEADALELLLSLPRMDPVLAERRVKDCNLADVSGWVEEGRKADPEKAAALVSARLRDRIPPPWNGQPREDTLEEKLAKLDALGIEH